jgi:PAS domain S-box-containing protein
MRPRSPLLHWFIPANYWDDTFTFYQARNIVNFSGIILVLGWVYAGIYFVLGFREATAVIAFFSLIDLAAPFALKYLQSVKIAGFLVCFSMYATLSGLVLLSGEAVSPGAIWYVAIPVMSILMNGALQGIAWGFISLFTLLSFFFIDWYIGPLFNLMPYEAYSVSWKTFHTSSTAGFLLFILIAALSAEKSKIQAFASMANAREGLLQKMQELETAHQALGQLNQQQQDDKQTLKKQAEALQATNAHLTSVQHNLVEALSTEQKTIQALKASEQKIRFLIDAMHEGLLSLDTNGKIVFCNQSLCNMLGYSRQELLYRQPSDFLDEANQLVFTREFNRGKAGLSPQQEITWTRKDGSCFHSIVAPQPFSGGEGLFAGSVAVVTDITPIKQVQQALAQREEKLQAIFHNASVGICLINAGGYITDSNFRLAEMLEKPLEEIVSRHYSTLVLHTENPLQEAFQKLVTGNTAQCKTNLQLATHSHRERWVSVSVSAVTHGPGDFQGVVAVLADITEQLQATEALRKSEEKYRMIMERANEAIVITVGDRVVLHNPKLEEFTGYNSEELMALPITHFIHPEDWPLVAKRLKGMEQYGRPLVQQAEFRILMKNGQTRWVGTVINQIEWEGEPAFQDFLEDITARKKAEEELKQMQLQLVHSEKMASLGQLTAGIAHEINNPVNFISGNVNPLTKDLEEIKEAFALVHDFLTQGPAPDQRAIEKTAAKLKAFDLPFLFEEMEALIRGIQEGAVRTKEIVLGLRNFSRLDEEDLKEADLHQCLDATLRLLQNELKNRIEVHKNYGQLPLVSCYPGKLNQVFMNILSNAQQAIEGKGAIYLQTWSQGRYVYITIRDTGKGMSDQVKSRIFEPFYTTKEIGQGTGLGLSISYGIIQQHRGHIAVKSKPGEGTTFTIRIPLQLQKN